MLGRTFESSRHLGPRHWFLLGVLGAASFFEGYDFFIVTVALPDIRATFGLSQADASLWLSILYLGALPAVLASRRADVVGRRRLLLASIVGYTVFTAATAVAPTIGWFVAMQFAARLFLSAEVALAWTMVAEELPAASRGFGFGWLAMLSALGAGIGAIVYGAAFAPLGISWRWLYVTALPPLATITYFRRRLPESTRFTAARDAGHLASRWHEILRPPHRRWLGLVCVTAALGALTTHAGTFTIDFMQSDRGLSATAANLVLVAAGALAVPVLVGSGALSDRYGRKVVGCAFGIVSIVGGAGFFLLATGPLLLFVFLWLTFVGQFGSWPTLGAFNSELFPTRLRASAGSWATVFRVTGQFLSFVLGSFLIRATGELSWTAVILGFGPVLTFGIILAWFPETKGRELEEIAGEMPLAIDVATPPLEPRPGATS
jgi:MFS family permease